MKEIFIQKEIKKLIEELDVSDSKYEQATNRYNSIAEYIKSSDVSKQNPDIYLQGSFKLGTAIKPLTNDGAYDIDIVCNFTKLRRRDQSQFSLKYDLGVVVKEYAKIQSMVNPPKESKRCWTLNYVDDDNFHIDILPSVPLNEKEDGYIAITDKTKRNYFDISSDWETSNPKGYAEWFRDISKFKFYQENIAKRFYASIEQVPEYKVKTPLQRIVQIIKRHAEVCFENNIEFKPSSIIITTLIAKQYQAACLSNDNILDVIIFIIEHLTDGIDVKDGKPCVYNPVNHDEVLSGKWEKDENYFNAFKNWVIQLKADFSVENSDIEYADKILYIKRSLFRNENKNFPIVNVKDIKHHQKSRWIENLKEKVIINCWYTYKGFRLKKIVSGTALSKNGDLKFEVQANNLKDYEIWWQITNTGKEAENAHCLRGDFYDSQMVEGKKVRKESTRYTGHHYVEAYLVKNGVCYGKSEPFEVNIVDGFSLDFFKMNKL